jgi:MFS family permease
MNTMRKNALMLRIMFVFFLMFFAVYIPMTQRIPYLTSLGYSNEQQNFIFSIQAFVAFIYQLIFGFLCDKYRTIKKFFILAMGLAITGIYLMFIQTQQVFYFHLLTIAVLGSFANASVGLLDSWALEIDPVIQRNYGAVRAMGTIGWIVGGYVVTLVFERFGYSALGLTFAVTSIALLIFSTTLRDAVKQSSIDVKLRDVKELFLNKRYMLITLALLFTMMLALSDGLVVVMKMEAIGATALEKYLRFAIQAVVELPLFFLGAHLLKRYSPLKILRFAIVVFAIRYIAYGFAPNAFWMIVVSLLQAFTFPLLMITSKVLILDESPAHLKSSGQMVSVSIYNGIGAAMVPLLLNVLIVSRGIDFSLIFVALMMVVPIGILTYLIKTA